MRASESFPFFCICAAAGVLSSCTPDYQPPQVAATHKTFKKAQTYPETLQTYSNPDLLGEVRAKKSILVDMRTKRGILYVNGQVALDFPVNIGYLEGAQLQPGTYTVESVEDKSYSQHFGNLYRRTQSTATEEVGTCIQEFVTPSTPRPRNCFYRGTKLVNWIKLKDSPFGFHSDHPSRDQKGYMGYIGVAPGTSEILYDEVHKGTKVIVQD